MKAETCKNSFCAYIVKVIIKGSFLSKYLCNRETLEEVRITANMTGWSISYLRYTEMLMTSDMLHNKLL